MNTREDTPSHEAPSPGMSDRSDDATPERITGKQWMAICCVICLLFALFLFMHGGEF